MERPARKGDGAVLVTKVLIAITNDYEEHKDTLSCERSKYVPAIDEKL